MKKILKYSLIILLTITACKKKTTGPGSGNGGNGGSGSSNLGYFHLRIWTINKNADSVEYAFDTLRYFVANDWIDDRVNWDVKDYAVKLEKPTYFYRGNYLELIAEVDLPVGVERKELGNIYYGWWPGNPYGGWLFSHVDSVDYSGYDDIDSTGIIKLKNGTELKPAIFEEFSLSALYGLRPDTNNPYWKKVLSFDTLDIAVVFHWDRLGSSPPYLPDRERFVDPFENNPDSTYKNCYFIIIDPDTFPPALIAKGGK